MVASRAGPCDRIKKVHNTAFSALGLLLLMLQTLVAGSGARRLTTESIPANHEP